MSAITVGEELVHYEVLGRGRPVVLLHTWIGSWRYWIPIMRQLQMKYRVYAIDLFGFGDSSKNPQCYPISKQTELIDDFLKQMGIPKAALIAHGLGAHVALEFARKSPERVARLLVTGAPLFAPDDLAARLPAGHRVLLTPTAPPTMATDDPDPGPVAAQPAGQGATPTGQPATPGANAMLSTADATVETPAVPKEPTEPNRPDLGQLHQAALERGRASWRGDDESPQPGRVEPVDTDNPLHSALQGGMRSLLSRCFKHSEPEFEQFQADIAKADDAVIAESARDFKAGEFLDTIRLLRLPTVIAHGEQDPLVPAPNDELWHYLTIGNEDTLLPVPLPEVRHFPMIEHEPFQRLVGLFLETQDVSTIEVKHRWRRRSR